MGSECQTPAVTRDGLPSPRPAETDECVRPMRPSHTNNFCLPLLSKPRANSLESANLRVAAPSISLQCKYKDWEHL